MISTRKSVTVKLEPDSELAKALAAAENMPVVLVSDGRRYLVSRVPGDGETGEELEEFRAALQAAAGVFTPEEAEQLQRNIYRWREEGSRPINRP